MRTMTDHAALLRAYDDQLRTDAEAHGALSVRHLGPLWLMTFTDGQGLVSYRDLAGADVPRLVSEALAHYRADPAIEQVEWKTRGHDRAPRLHETLVAHGFTPAEPESIMLGEAAALAVEVPLPPGVTLRRITAERDVRALCAMQDEAFGQPSAHHGATALLRRLADDDGLELWAAEAGGRIVSAGRLEPVPGTDFAGIWGGATLPAWRHRGIYRALTAARARSALAAGRTLLHSDSTEYSRPILARAGLHRVSTTTPYTWHRRTG
jgi:hypothetical protein